MQAPTNYRMGRSTALRARPGDSLTMDQLQAVAPSIFATERHESRSERYAYIPTHRVVEGLMAEDFHPVFAQQGLSRIEGKAPFTKHLIRFRKGAMSRVGDETFEVVLKNAHDGTSAYLMEAGVFRLLCLNGLTVGDMDRSVKVKHTGDAVSKVIEGAYEVLGLSDDVMGRVDGFRGIRLSRDERLAFAEAAHILRFPAAYAEDPDERKPAPIEPERLLRARRPEDEGADLWRTFNRAQENIMRGGIPGHVRTAQGRVRHSRTRPINGIDQGSALNRALWTLTERMAELTAGGRAAA